MFSTDINDWYIVLNVKQGQMLRAEAEAKILASSPGKAKVFALGLRPRSEDGGQEECQFYEAHAEAKPFALRPSQNYCILGVRAKVRPEGRRRRG